MQDRKAYMRVYNKRVYAEKKRAGLCTMCGKTRFTVYALRCNDCEARHRESARKCRPVVKVEQLRTRIFQDSQGVFI